jgi:hypothetical protein
MGGSFCAQLLTLSSSNVPEDLIETRTLRRHIGQKETLVFERLVIEIASGSLVSAIKLAALIVG